MNQEMKPNSVDGIPLASKGEAEDVLEALRALLSENGKVRISDYYALVGLGRATIFVDERWGWTDLSSAEINPTERGYIIRLPKTKILMRQEGTS
jgi:hypothetical protein